MTDNIKITHLAFENNDVLGGIDVHLSYNVPNSKLTVADMFSACSNVAELLPINTGAATDTDDSPQGTDDSPQDAATTTSADPAPATTTDVVAGNTLADHHLLTEVSKAAEILGPASIKKVIKDFVPTGKKRSANLKDIPQDVREKFLQELKKMIIDGKVDSSKPDADGEVDKPEAAATSDDTPTDRRSRRRHIHNV